MSGSGSKPDTALCCIWRLVEEVGKTVHEKKISAAAFLALAKAWALYW